MQHWSEQHRAFAVETFFNNNDSAAVMQRVFRLHFDIGRTTLSLFRCAVVSDATCVGFSADQYLNCVTQFNIVWHVGTIPFLPMSKCGRKIRFVTVAESLFVKNVSTANTRCSSDQRCMMTEDFKSFYPAMCVSLRHL
jgi:hypothetical protein